MPKVIYTPAKGLYQESGSGFEVGGASIVPTQTSLATYCIDIDAFNGGSGATAANLNTDGGFFVLSDKDATKVFWFTDSAEGTPASQPTVTAIRTAGFTGAIDAYVTIETNTVTTAIDVVGLIKIAVDAALTGVMTDNGNASASYEAALPYVPKAIASKGNLASTTITVNNAGLGDHNSYTLNAYGANYIDGAGLAALAVEDAYVLPDGSLLGQEVFVVMALINAETHTMTGKIQKSLAGVTGGLTGQGGTAATFTGVTGNNPSLLLMWDGIQWLVKCGYSVTVA